MKNLLLLLLFFPILTSIVSAQSGCTNSIAGNGNLSQGTAASSGHQNIDDAVNFSRIWSTGSFAEFYTANYAPSGYPTPSPATGNYASCWIANYAGGGTGYREGFKSQLATPIAKNSGVYDLSFDIACLNSNGWGTPEVAVYGVYNPTGNAGATPTGAYTPSNIDLYGATNTVLLGTITAGSSCSNVKTNHTFSFNASNANFPANGITHFFVTHSDNQSISGARYMAFDNFCIQDVTPLCPEILQTAVVCERDISSLLTGNHTFSVYVNNPGTMNFSVSCGTISPTTITGAGPHTFTITGAATCTFPFVQYQAVDNQGNICNTDTIPLNLPNCQPPCPDIGSPPTISCEQGTDNQPTGNHIITVSINNPGSMYFSVACGTVSPSIIYGVGSHDLTVTGTGTCNSPFILDYIAVDYQGNICHTDTLEFILPNCQPLGFCPNGFTNNGDLSQGTAASNGHQNIDDAVNFSRIWSTGSFAEFYTANYAPSGYPTPSPATGNYASCWIANYAGGGTGYREGFKSQLATPIAKNSGIYDLSFDIACLNSNGWGTPEVAVYGVYNPTGNAGATPTGAYTPSNIDLYGATNTVLLGTITAGNSCSNVKTNHTFSFNASNANFPANGITHFFVTHSDNQSISGARYMAFDNFCIQASAVVPCPEVSTILVDCEQTGINTLTGNHTLTFTTTHTGTINFNPTCGTVSPSSITSPGTHTLSLVGANTCGNIFALNYEAIDPTGVVCSNNGTLLNLPSCQPPCPEIVETEATCINDINGDGFRDYEVQLLVSTAGTINLSTSCGTVSPSTLSNVSAGIYTVTVTSNQSCLSFILDYQSSDVNGNICITSNVQIQLPRCLVLNLCPCDKSLITNAEAGFSQLLGCPDDIFTPNSLDACDEVIWTIDRNIVANTHGNTPFVTPHLYGFHEVCMIVQRTQPDGEVCQHRKCAFVRSPIECPGSPGDGIIGIGFQQINVNPNPAIDILDVTWSTEKVPNQLSISIFNTNGVQVQRIDQVNGHEGKLQFNVQKLVSGLYFIKIEGENYRPNPIKFIKTN